MIYRWAFLPLVFVDKGLQLYDIFFWQIRPLLRAPNLATMRANLRTRKLTKRLLRESGGTVNEQFGTKTDDFVRAIATGRCRRARRWCASTDRWRCSLTDRRSRPTSSSSAPASRPGCRIWRARSQRHRASCIRSIPRLAPASLSSVSCARLSARFRRSPNCRRGGSRCSRAAASRCRPWRPCASRSRTGRATARTSSTRSRSASTTLSLHPFLRHARRADRLKPRCGRCPAKSRRFRRIHRRPFVARTTAWSDRTPSRSSRAR